MKELKMKNFRCFSEQNISFRSGINLLVGDNASGKTSVLKACKYVLSAFFSGFSDENTNQNHLDTDDFREVIVDGIVLPEQPINLFFNIDDTIEHTELLERGRSLIEDIELYNYALVKNSKKNERSLITGIKGYKLYGSSLKEVYFTESGQQKSLPLFASFSTEDIHSARKINEKRFKTYNHKPSFGYYECLDGEGFFKYWIKRLLVLNERNQNDEEVLAVYTALREALDIQGCGIICGMDIRHNQGKVYFELIDGREVEADLLSDGYRRIVNIVLDLAFRCAILNRGLYGINAARETKGTVLIDEIDLHLHPTLQSTILKGLRNAFPRLQFIVTTHAPMVMSGIENNDENIVYKLDYSNEEGYTIESVNAYGMDMSTISEIILEQTPRNIETEDKLEELFALIDDNRFEEARVALNSMKDRYGSSIPELAQAEAMLNCIADDDDEEN